MTHSADSKTNGVSDKAAVLKLLSSGATLLPCSAKYIVLMKPAFKKIPLDLSLLAGLGCFDEQGSVHH